MWHASAAGCSPTIGREFLERMALEALKGVGDVALGQWIEWTGKALHVRRRLSADESSLVGPVRDVRGTYEGRLRAERALRVYRGMVPPGVLEELREIGEID